MVLAIIAVLIGLLLPAVQKVRESANRLKCMNNLKQISLACHNYHDVNNTLPTLYSYWPFQFSANGANYEQFANPSAFVLLLPYLEQQALYQSMYRTVYMQTFSSLFPFFGGPFAIPVSLYACPSDSGLPSPPIIQDNVGWAFDPPGTYWPMTSYRPNSGAGYRSGGYYYFPSYGGLGFSGVVGLSEVSIAGISDGTSNTILFGEGNNFDLNWPQYAATMGWWAPPSLAMFGSKWSDLNPFGIGGCPFAIGDSPLNNRLPSPPPPKLWGQYLAVVSVVESFGSGHIHGANFAFCDGSVRFISNSINNAATVLTSYGSVTLLGALCTRDGGEVIDDAQY